MHVETPAVKHLQQGRSTLLLEQSARKLSSDKRQMPYGMGTLKIPLQSIRSEEGPHYCLGAKREEAVI
jgi:hypothetical protein